MFCGPCSLLLSNSQRRDKGLFVNKPFSNWVKISGSLSSHSRLQYHRDCLQLADALNTTTENPEARINVMTSNAVQKKISENRQIDTETNCTSNSLLGTARYSFSWEGRRCPLP